MSATCQALGRLRAKEEKCKETNDDLPSKLPGTEGTESTSRVAKFSKVSALT